MVHRSVIDVVEDLARPSVQLGTTLLPPPIGGHDPETGLIARVSEGSQKATQDFLDRIEPDPPESVRGVLEQKKFESPVEGRNNVLTLTLPQEKQKVDGDNLFVIGQKDDPVTGNDVTKIGNNGQKVGGNGRPVVKEVRQAVRATVKDVRQGVHDVVKAVTGLGKKKDEKPAQKNEDAAPAQ